MSIPNSRPTGDDAPSLFAAFLDGKREARGEGRFSDVRVTRSGEDEVKFKSVGNNCSVVWTRVFGGCEVGGPVVGLCWDCCMAGVQKEGWRSGVSRA